MRRLSTLGGGRGWWELWRDATQPSSSNLGETKTSADKLFCALEERALGFSSSGCENDVSGGPKLLKVIRNWDFGRQATAMQPQHDTVMTLYLQTIHSLLFFKEAETQAALNVHFRALTVLSCTVFQPHERK